MAAPAIPTAGSMPRPDLTLPKAEAAWLAEFYGVAGTILEYGSGGSTVLAAEMPGKTVYSVESDLAWAADMAAYFEENPVASVFDIRKASRLLGWEPQFDWRELEKWEV